MKKMTSSIYHRGYLVKDRKTAGKVDEEFTIAAELNFMAEKYWKLAAANIVYLTQRRCGEFDYEYMVTEEAK